MTGFFFAAAVVTGTVLFARMSVRWRAWLAGSAFGAIPAVPWLSYVWINHVPDDVLSTTSAGALFQPDFFRVAFDIGLSRTADFNLGNHLQTYLTFPVLSGVPTNGVGVARTVLNAVGIVALVAVALAAPKKLRRAPTPRQPSDTSLCLVNAAIAGLLFSLAGVSNVPHHHLMMFPLEFLWLPLAVLSCAPKPRIWLVTVWLGSIVCTFGFLQFIHAHCGAPEGDYGVAYRCQENPAARSPDLVPLIRPGQEEILGRMLGRGEVLPGGCRLTGGKVEDNVVAATYACDSAGITLRLMHPSKAADDAVRTANFAVVRGDGSPPAGLLEAVTEHVRENESAFEWLLEAGRATSVDDASGPPPHGYLPVLTSRQVVARLLAGAAILLLLSPWWAAQPRVSQGPKPSASA
jgi:hypothetical protein